MTPWLWESLIYINILMNLAILSELLGLFGLKCLGLAKNRLNRPSTLGKIAELYRLVTSKAEGSYFGPKHLEQIISIFLKISKPSQGNTRQLQVGS